MAFSQVIRQQWGDHDVYVRHAKERDMDDVTMMPGFFERDFTLATATGFIRIWDGTYVTLRYLKEHSEDLGITKGANVIELGAGAGLLGLCIASMGANVLLTDVKSSVDCITSHNVELNAKGRPLGDILPPSEEENKTPSSSIPSATQFTPKAVEGFFAKAAKAYHVGDGTAAALPLDWSIGVTDEINACLDACDRIVACDCVWLPSLAEMCGSIFAQLLSRCRKGTKALLTYSHRGVDPKCTSPEQLEKIFAGLGLKLSWLHTAPSDPSNTKEPLDISLIDVELMH